MCSARVGFRKNNRGSRSRCLKLEINERITGSLSENNCAGHQRPGRGHGPAGQTCHRCFDVTVTERAMDANHDNHQVQRGSKWPNLITAERNVKIIAQESGKRNVPAPPEIGETDRGVRKTEVVLQVKTKSQSKIGRASCRE